MAAAAADVSSIADALGIGQFAVMGHSGGGAHALACGALLPDRVVGVVCVAGLAPFHAEGLDWFAGMAAAGAAELRAAARGRAALEAALASPGGVANDHHCGPVEGRTQPGPQWEGRHNGDDWPVRPSSGRRRRSQLKTLVHDVRMNESFVHLTE